MREGLGEYLFEQEMRDEGTILELESSLALPNDGMYSIFEKNRESTSLTKFNYL